MMLLDCNDIEFYSGNCIYYDFSATDNLKLFDLFLIAHLNIRLFSIKIGEVDTVINMPNFPKMLLLSRPGSRLDRRNRLG